MNILKKINNKPILVVEQLILIWNYRHLIRMFFKRDIKIKYAQTKLKVIWIVVQPLLMMFVFTFFFGYVLKWKADNIPYPIYVFSGLIIWNIFQSIIQNSVTIYFDNSSLIKYNNFPKITIVIAKILSSLVDSLLSISILIVLMIFYSQVPSWKILLFFLPMLLTSLLALSIALFALSISYKKRDFIFMLPYLMSFLLWVTPIFFTTNIFPENLKFFIYLNPIAGLVDIWRACLFQNATFDFGYLVILTSIIPLSIFAFVFYCKKDSNITDYL